MEQYTSEQHPDYPLFWVNSCALAYALQRPDFNAMFEGTICAENHCPPEQRERCAINSLGYKPSQEAVQEALEQMDLDYSFDLNEEEKMIYVDGDVSHGQLIYLRQKLNYPIKTCGDLSSTNEWAGQASNRESIHLPYASENFDIDVIWERAQYTRNLFRSVERIQWGAEQYALELMVQVGHLSDLVLRQEHKLNKRTEEENADALADEISDVILNIFSIADEFSLSLPNLLRDEMGLNRTEIVDSARLAENKQIESEEQVSQAMLELSKQSALLASMVTEVVEDKMKKEYLKKVLLESFDAAMTVLDFYKVNLHKAFDKMILESEAFVDKNKLK